MAHLCIHVAVMDGTADLAFKIESKGLWSVTIVKWHPYKYLWNFLTPYTNAKASFSIYP